jgi:hypothetical protein
LSDAVEKIAMRDPMGERKAHVSGAASGAVIPLRCRFHWWARQGSNLQPDRYERPALTIELQAPPQAAAFTAGNGADTPYIAAGDPAMLRSSPRNFSQGAVDTALQRVIAGLDPAIHFLWKRAFRRQVDARIKSGHDTSNVRQGCV